MEFRFDDKLSSEVISIKYRLGVSSNGETVQHAISLLKFLTENGYNLDSTAKLLVNGDIIISNNLKSV